MKFLLLLAVCLATTHAAIPGHLVESLPGFEGKLPSKHYSGVR